MSSSRSVLAWCDPMIGLAVGRVGVNRKGGLIVDLGRPVRPRGYQRGEWRLGVFSAAWRLQSGDRVLVGWGDERERAAEVLQCLLHARLRRIEVEENLVEGVFVFDDKELHFLQYYTGPDERFDVLAVWAPSERQLRVGPGGRLREADEWETL